MDFLKPIEGASVPRKHPKVRLEEGVAKLIYQGLQRHGRLDLAAEAAGVKRATVERWIQIGMERGKGKYFRFYEECIRTIARAETMCADTIMKAIKRGGDGGARIAISWLKQMNPGRWDPNRFGQFIQNNTVTNTQNVVITSQEAKKFSEEDRLKLYRRACLEAGVEVNDAVMNAPETSDVAHWDRIIQIEQEVIDSIDFSDLV